MLLKFDPIFGQHALHSPQNVNATTRTFLKINLLPGRKNSKKKSICSGGGSDDIVVWNENNVFLDAYTQQIPSFFTYSVLYFSHFFLQLGQAAVAAVAAAAAAVPLRGHVLQAVVVKFHGSVQPAKKRSQSFCGVCYACAGNGKSLCLNIGRVGRMREIAKGKTTAH